MEPATIPANGATLDSRLQTMQAEIDRLSTALQAAEKRLRDTEAQRDKYHEFTKLWIEQNCPMSDWDDFDPADYTHEFKDTLAEIEAHFKQ